MKIAIFLPNWIGDAVMATPALRALRARYPDAELTAILKPYIAGVIDGCPWFDDRLFLDSRGPWSTSATAVAAQLWRRGIDWAILFPNTFRSAMVAWLARSRRIVGFNRYGRRWMLSDALDPAWDSTGRLKPTPALDDYNRIAERAGCPWPGYRLELFTGEAEERAADEFWQQSRLGRQREVICFNPGAAFGASKHWYAESFASLAQQLIDTRGCAIVVLCGPAERAMARQIATLTARTQIVSLADQRLSLGLAKACIRRSDLLVTTDSGPRHFATAFNKPVVTLFGPTHIAWTETYHPLGIHLQKQVDCGPCQRRVCPVDHRCMKLLTPHEVFNAVQVLLAKPLLRKAS